MARLDGAEPMRSMAAAAAMAGRREESVMIFPSRQHLADGRRRFSHRNCVSMDCEAEFGDPLNFFFFCRLHGYARSNQALFCPKP
jgi:hypothetical protein